jgi:hypothetical protein
MTEAMVLKYYSTIKINSSQQTKYKYDTDRNQLRGNDKINELLGNDATDNKQITGWGGKKRK